MHSREFAKLMFYMCMPSLVAAAAVETLFDYTL